MDLRTDWGPNCDIDEDLFGPCPAEEPLIGPVIPMGYPTTELDLASRERDRIAPLLVELQSRLHILVWDGRSLAQAEQRLRAFVEKWEAEALS